VALLFALACGGLLILWAGRQTVFLQDEWAFVTTRLGGDADAYLKPHNEHLMLFPVAVFKALFAVAGLGNYWAYRLALTIVHLICVALLFVIVERRRGVALAALVAAPILLLGSSSEVLLFPIDLGFAGSMVGALGAMLALDARSRRGDIVAGLLVAFALASSGLGISIALGVLVELMWGRDRWRRVWVVAAPAALYGAWYLNYNRHPNRQGPLEYTEAPLFAVRVAGAAVAGLLGIPEFETATTRLAHWSPRIGIGLALVGGATLAWLVVVRRRLTARLAGLIVTLGSYWAFIGVSRAYTDAPGASRYIYPGAILILLIAVEATRGLPIGRQVLAALAVAALGATALNVHWLDWNGDQRRKESRIIEADLGALEIERGYVPLDFRPISLPAYPLTAGGYFAAVDALRGSVAVPPGELTSEADRAAADSVLIQGAASRVPHTSAARRFLEAAGDEPANEYGRRAFAAADLRSCKDVRPVQGGPAVDTLTVPPFGLVVAPRGDVPVSVSLRRFADSYATPLPPVTGGPQLLLTPLGRSPTPWQARLTASGPFQVC
jgi:hypothetical protein